MTDVRAPSVQAFDKEDDAAANIILSGCIEPFLEQYLESEADRGKVIFEQLKSVFDRFFHQCVLRAGLDNRTIAEGRGCPQVPAGGVTC